MHRQGSAAKWRTKWCLTLVGLSLLLSNCVWAEGPGGSYVIQNAGITGWHITISNDYTGQLLLASDVIAQGVNIDAVLKERGINTTCPKLGGRTNGDRCAFNIVGSIKMTGWMSAYGNIFWRDAIKDDEFDDFRHDMMGPARAQTSRCGHVTIHHRGEWPFEWQDSNWTFRERSDAQC